MKKNKGIIGIGLIIAIVLGIVIVGGGAYYLSKSGNKQEVNNPADYLPTNQDQNLPVVENPRTPQVVAECTSNSPSTIKLISPNGGEVYQAGQKITVKWKSCNVNPGSIGIGLVKHDLSTSYKQEQGLNDYPDFVLGGYDVYKGTADDGIQEITLPNNSVSRLDSGKQYFISISGTGDATNVGSGYRPEDYSDGLFTINKTTTNSEESSTEVFNHQPGAIKSIKADGVNKWILAVDLLTYNPNWGPGTDIGGGFFINQNTKIRNLNISNSTKIKNCTTQYSGFASELKEDLASFITYVGNAIKRTSAEFGYTAYFDISGSNITAIYEQCLP